MDRYWRFKDRRRKMATLNAATSGIVDDMLPVYQLFNVINLEKDAFVEQERLKRAKEKEREGEHVCRGTVIGEMEVRRRILQEDDEGIEHSEEHEQNEPRK